jgi:aspartate/methionine/tyrosine aminotransferase
MAIEKESPEESGHDHIPFNLAESSVADRLLGELPDASAGLRLGYTDHRGKKELRALLARELGLSHPDQVLITAGSAAALFIVYTTLLSQEDHLIVAHPNYASCIEVPVAIGCGISYASLRFEKAWVPDPDEIARLVGPSTRMISMTTPHNPTGTVLNESLLTSLGSLIRKKSILLLVDETYREVRQPASRPLVAALEKRAISVGSLSKAFGLPGIRIGWLVCQDERLMEQFLAAKELIHITNSALDEHLAYLFLLEKQRWMGLLHPRVQDNFQVLRKWLEKEKRLECVLPEGGVVCFPRVRSGVSMDMPAFYRLLLEKYQTIVAPGHWFEMPDQYMRIGFGWLDKSGLATALDHISLAIDEMHSKAGISPV